MVTLVPTSVDSPMVPTSVDSPMSTADPAKSDPVEPRESQSTLDEEENREPERSVNEEIPSTGRIRFMNWPSAESETSQVNTNRNTASWFRRDAHQENRIKAPSAEMVSVNSTVLGNPEKDIKSAPPAASSKFTWFHKEKKQDDINFAAMKDLDERAKKNVQAPPWWMFGDQNSAVVDPNMNLNTTYRSYRESNGLDENAATTTAIVQRSNAMNMLWNALSRAFQQNSIWRAATKANKQTDKTSNTRVGAAALFIHAIQRPFQRRKQQANDNDGTSESAETTSAPRTRRWGFFARSWSQKNDEELGASSSEETTSTAIVHVNPSSHPVAVAMRKVAAGLGGTCMVVVGVPLLLLPGNYICILNATDHFSTILRMLLFKFLDQGSQ
jgi:hypothetical protein